MTQLPWYKAHREIEATALKGAVPAVRAIYHHLCYLSDSEWETIKTTKKYFKDEFKMGYEALTKALKELKERGLIMFKDQADKKGLIIDFCFAYNNATITKSEEKQSPKQDAESPKQDSESPKQDSPLPFIISREESIHAFSPKEVVDNEAPLFQFLEGFG